MSRMYKFNFTVVHNLIGINYIHLILSFLAVKVAFRQTKHQEPTYCTSLLRYCIISILFVQCSAALRFQSIIKLIHILQKSTLEFWPVQRILDKIIRRNDVYVFQKIRSYITKRIQYNIKLKFSYNLVNCFNLGPNFSSK